MNVFLLLVGASCIALAPIFTQLGMQEGDIGPAAAAFWRVALAVPLFAVLDRVLPDRPRAPTRGDVLWLCLPGVFFAGDVISWHSSFQFIPLANATLLANLSVIFVSVTGFFWFKERFGLSFVAGALLALGGVALLVQVDFGSSALAGDGLGVLTALFYASYIVSVKRLRGRYGTLQIMAWSSATCAVLCLPFAFAMGENVWPATAAGWWALLGLALISHGGGQGLIAYALAHLPAGFLAVTLLWQPVLVAVLSWWIFGQQLSGQQMAGGGMVLVGIALARLGSR